MKIKIKNFKHQNIAIKCKTPQELKEFIKCLGNADIHWRAGVTGDIHHVFDKDYAYIYTSSGVTCMYDDCISGYRIVYFNEFCLENVLENNFEEYGFTGDFDGEIFKEIDSVFYGIVYSEYFERNIVCEWDSYGNVISNYKIDGDYYKLTPIKKEWYENPDNFPCLVIYDDKEIKLMGSYSETSKFRTEPCLLTAEGWVYYSLSKCRLATEEEALKLVKKG